MKKVSIALAGNPNCGKTTVFNALTGSKQRIGNWPGVTVERMEGKYTFDDTEVTVIDLPGIYSFSAFSLDERISREYILKDKPDAVVNVVDASNLERNLYLTTQLLEMKVPVVVALNMMDVAKRRKIKIELKHLEEHLGCPVIPIVASRKEGIEHLRRHIADMAERHHASHTRVYYDEEVEEAIEILEKKGADVAERNGVAPRWLALKLLERDELAASMSNDDLDNVAKQEIKRVERHVGDEIDLVIADGRYGFIHGLVRDVMNREDELRRTISDRIDKVALNRLVGIPVFIAVMFAMFVITFNVGAPFIDFFDILCGTIFVDGFKEILLKTSLPQFLIAFLSDGLGGSIQTISTFIPPIFLIFFCLSILEDSGYMARAAFIMDRLLRIIGLPGKAFVPMLTGLGCNVPAIMATRTLENERDRILTVLINPFVSCGARLPVYAMFATVFFPDNGGHLIFAMYALGLVLAILSGLLFKHTILRGEVSTFVMELPPYHIPTAAGVMHHTWNRLKSFIIKAGKVIMLAVIVLSLGSAIDTDGSLAEEGSSESILSAAGKAVSPVFRPMGVTEENWPASVGLFTGLFAKEAVIGTLDSLYTQLETKDDAADDVSEEEPFDFWGGVQEAFRAIPEGFTGFWSSLSDPLGVRAATSSDEGAPPGMAKHFGRRASAVAYLIFILVYAPCVAAIAAIYREIGARWTIFSVSYLTALAWALSTAFYQTVTFFEHPTSSIGWLAVIGMLFACFYAGLRIKSKQPRAS